MKSCPRLFLIAISLTLLVAAPLHAGSFKWETNLAKAQEVAKRENKPVFLLFTGSSWCGVCALLDKNILSKEAFRKFAADRLIAVKIDFKDAPFHDNGQVNKPSTSADKAKFELAKQYNVNVGQKSTNGLNGYPSVFILSSEGARLGQVNANINVANGAPDPFIKEIEKLIPPATKP